MPSFLIALAGIGLLLGSGLPLPAQLQLPSGIIDEEVAGGFDRPVGFAFLPDGRVLLVEQNTARIRVVSGASSAVVGTVPGVATGDLEQGLLAIAADPAWPAEPFVYVLATIQAPPAIHVIRYEVSGDLAAPGSLSLSLGSAYRILDDLPDANAQHNGGTLRFGNDGMLYVSLGDDEVACSAQDPEALSGKILRLDVAAVRSLRGAGPPPKAWIKAAGNPFNGPHSQLVWASGFRNPFRFAIDPVTGQLVVGDVGDASWEEIDLVDGPGLDFGWPFFEGPVPGSTCATGAAISTAPIFAYPQVTGAAIVPLGGRYRNPVQGPLALGADYEGDVLVTDFVTGDAVRLKEVQGAWVITPAPGQPDPVRWATGLNLVTDALTGPDGALWYTKLAPGSLRRLRPAPSQSLQLQKVAGDLQAGTALRTLPVPLEILCTDGQQQAVANVPVTFSLLAGQAQLDPQPVMTAPDGRAATGVLLGAATSANPILIRATVAGAAPVVFSVTWRGLSSDYDAASRILATTLRHERAGVPVTVVFQPPSPLSYPTPLGDIVVDVFAPPPGAVWFDGLGLFGPPQGVATTGPLGPSWTASIGPVPLALGGQLYVIQGFAIDPVTYPDPESFLISNPVSVLF